MSPIPETVTPSLPPNLQPTPEPVYREEPMYREVPRYYREEDPPEMMDKNVVMMIFIAFVAGLLLGKIMNPVILKH